MDFTEVVQKRRMVRHFRPDPVPRELIERILTLARQAPSAGFTQGQAFIVVTELETRQAIARLCNEEEYISAGFHPFISEAPVLLVPCADEQAYHRRYQEPDKLDPDGSEIVWPVPYWIMDIGCAVMLVLLGAVNEGLDAGFAGAHDLDALRTLLNIPSTVWPVGVIPVGYRAQDVPSGSLKRGRVPDEVYLHDEHW